MQTFTWLFLAALCAGALLQFWLLRRQYRTVALHRDQVPEAFAQQVTAAEHQKAADYSLAKVRLAGWELAIGLALVLAWTLGGGLDALQNWWLRGAYPAIPTGVGLVLSFFVVSSLLNLPLSVWHTFVTEARFGFNRATPMRFLLDQVLGLLLGLGLGGLLAWAFLWLMDQAGAAWWLAAWAVWVLFTLTIAWAYPVLIAPIFNRFTPLAEGELRHRVQELLERCGFCSRGIFVMDGSRRSGHGNAYFSGFGRSKRIVFFDTLIDLLSIDELEAVLAHELGHFRLRHVGKRLLGMAALSLAGLALLGWLMQQSWFYSGLGVTQPSDAAALLLFLIAAPIFSVFLEPIATHLSRRHEYQADAYAVAQTGGQSLIRALVKLYTDNANTLTPDPLYSAFHDSHPPAPLRIAYISSKMAPTAESETSP